MKLFHVILKSLKPDKIQDTHQINNKNGDILTGSKDVINRFVKQEVKIEENINKHETKVTTKGGIEHCISQIQGTTSNNLSNIQPNSGHLYFTKRILLRNIIP